MPDAYNQEEEDKAQALCKRFEQLSNDRASWNNHWEEIASFVIPGYVCSFGGTVSPGAKNTHKMYDATASNACVKFASALESMLTPRGETWHLLQPLDLNVLEDMSARNWFERVNNILFHYRYEPEAGYAQNQHEIYMSLGAFGTGCLYVDERRDNQGRIAGLRYQTVFLGDLYFVENYQGVVDTVFRRFEFTALQAVQKWGRDKLSEKIIASLEKEPDQKFKFFHAVFPMDTRKNEGIRHSPLVYDSVYVSFDDKRIMETGGYRTFPYIVSRYLLAPGEVYGRSPAMLALPDIKTVNEIHRTVLKHGQRSADPVLLAPDDGNVTKFNLRPGVVNYGFVNRDGRSLVQTLPVGNMAETRFILENKIAAINSAFLVDLFQSLADPEPRVTTAAIMEAIRQKGALLSPTMGRQQSEALEPMIQRELDILYVNGRLPPIPPVLQKGLVQYKPRYTSPLSRTQQAEVVSGIVRTLETVVNVSVQTQNAALLDVFNMDELVKRLAFDGGVPASCMNSGDDIIGIREKRNEAMAQQQQIAATPGAAQLIKALSSAPASAGGQGV